MFELIIPVILFTIITAIFLWWWYVKIVISDGSKQKIINQHKTEIKEKTNSILQLFQEYQTEIEEQKKEQNELQRNKLGSIIDYLLSLQNEISQLEQKQFDDMKIFFKEYDSLFVKLTQFDTIVKKTRKNKEKNKEIISFIESFELNKEIDSDNDDNEIKESTIIHRTTSE